MKASGLNPSKAHYLASRRADQIAKSAAQNVDECQNERQVPVARLRTVVQRRSVVQGEITEDGALGSGRRALKVEDFRAIFAPDGEHDGHAHEGQNDLPQGGQEVDLHLVATDLHLQPVQAGDAFHEIGPPGQGRHHEGHTHQNGQGNVAVELVRPENEDNEGSHLPGQASNVHDPAEGFAEERLLALVGACIRPETAEVLKQPEKGGEDGDVSQQQAAHQGVEAGQHDVDQDHQGDRVYCLYHQVLKRE